MNNTTPKSFNVYDKEGNEFTVVELLVSKDKEDNNPNDRTNGRFYFIEGAKVALDVLNEVFFRDLETNKIYSTYKNAKFEGIRRDAETVGEPKFFEDDESYNSWAESYSREMDDLVAKRVEGVFTKNEKINIDALPSHEKDKKQAS